jgi:hypothetical protein
MNSQPPNETLRVPPDRAKDGRSGVLAQRLRNEPVGLDELSRARMERTLVQAWRTHAAARVPLPGTRSVASGLRGLGLARLAASLAASAVAGGLIAFFLVGGDRASAPPAMGTAHFELRIGDAAVQSGTVIESQVLESGTHGRIEVDLGSAQLRMERDTRLRFERMSG